MTLSFHHRSKRSTISGRGSVCTLALAAALVAVGTNACGSSGSPTTPTTPPTVAASVTGCEVTTSTPGTPVGVTGGPYQHNIAFGFSPNGTSVTGFTEVLAHASVPDGVRLPDGTIGVYYVNGETDGVWLGRLTGSTLTPVSAITVDGIVRPAGIVDPDATLVNGRVRLAYLNGFSGANNGKRAMCLAESSDGLTFKSIAMAWDLGTNQNLTDPSALQLADGSWLMAISDGQTTRLARSSTGLSFTQYATVTSGGVPELAPTSDGRVRLYVCSGGILSYVSADAGSSWTREGTVVPSNTLGRTISCDPSYVPAAGLFIFKTA